MGSKRSLKSGVPANRGPIVALSVILVAGAIFAVWTAQRTDRWMRDDLLLEARLLASGIDPDSLAALAGAATDLHAAGYLRLKEYLALALRTVPECRFLYVVGRGEDGSVFFFADSEPSGAESESPPGQVYDEASDLLLTLFDSARPAVEGPLADRWGTWVSAFAPLVDPHTGQVVAVFGMDVTAQGWWSRIIAQAAVPLASTAVLALIVLGGTTLLRRRERPSAGSRRGRFARFAEVAIAIAVGLTVTLLLAHETRTQQERSRQDTSRRLASAKASLVMDALRDLGNQQLEALAHFFEASEHVDPREFREYTGFLVRDPAVRLLGWVPVVAAGERARAEEDARRDGLGEFIIWEKNLQGDPAPAELGRTHYPILHLAPLERHEALLGYDLGSDSSLRKVIESAASTGLTTGSDSISLVNADGNQRSFIIFRPVFAAGDRNRIAGFAVAEPRLDAMLRTPSERAAREEPAIALHLYRLRPDSAIPEMLAGDPDGNEAAPHSTGKLGHFPDRAFTLTQPIQIYGKTLAVTAHPSPVFDVLFPARAGWLTILYGSAFTFLLATLVGYVANRRLLLVRRVAARTAKLRASKARLSETLRSIGEGVIVADRAGLVTRMNPVAEKLTGWTEAEALGMPLEEVYRVPGTETRGVEPNPAARCLERGGSAETEDYTLLVARDATERPITETAAPIRNARGGITGVVVVFRDRTDERQAREALRESEERHRQLFLSNPHPMFVFDKETLGFLAVNDAAASRYGYSREEFLGMTIVDIHPPEDVSRLLRRVADVPDGIDFAGEWLHVGKDGTRILVEITSHPLEWRGRRAEVVLATDVAERRTVEEQIRLQALVLDQISDHVTVTDLSGRITYVNQAQVEALGYAHQELIGRSTEIHGEEADLGASQKEILQKTLRDGQWRGDVVNYSSDGNRLVMDCRTRVVRDRHGTPVALVGVGTDITEQRQAEDDRRKLLHAIEQSPALVIITDLDGNIEYVNPKFTQVTGYTLDEVRGRNPSILKSGETSPQVYRELWETIESGGEWHGEFHNKKKDGTLFWERAVVSSIRDAGGAITHFLAVKEDITAQKALEAQFLQAQKMETVGRLAGGVAHDFNNQLTIIMGLAEMVQARLDPGHELSGDLEEILQATRRSSELTRQLLGFARRQTICPKVLDLNDTVSKLLKMLRRLIGEGIQLIWRPGPELGEVTMDPTQIDQILANLSVNARDALEGAGTLAIETKNVVLDEAYCANHPGAVPGEYVLLTVSDDGCGMSREILDHVFEPFFTTKDKGKGTGLGLATVYGIVKQNRGFITIYSEPGQGTSVKVYLPRSPAKAPSVAAEGDPEPARGNETVLLVEDEESILRIGRRILEQCGYRVLATMRRDEALALAADYQGPIDLLLSDVVMPEVSGRELREKIESFRPSIKTVFMSGYPADTIGRRGVLDEGVRFLQKPFSVHSLAEIVRQALDA
jgi:two-component system, cell cycle sensor histidine kinase and response regulator CckA